MILTKIETVLVMILTEIETALVMIFEIEID